MPLAGVLLGSARLPIAWLRGLRLLRHNNFSLKRRRGWRLDNGNGASLINSPRGNLTNDNLA
jgi:hypothetical protein